MRLSTPFSGFRVYYAFADSVPQIQYQRFQLPFRDSSRLDKGSARQHLSTPFSGFSEGTGPPAGGLQAHFQLPFRDSERWSFFITLPTDIAFNSLFGIPDESNVISDIVSIHFQLPFRDSLTSARAGRALASASFNSLFGIPYPYSSLSTEDNLFQLPFRDSMGVGTTGGAECHRAFNSLFGILQEV